MEGMPASMRRARTGRNVSSKRGPAAGRASDEYARDPDGAAAVSVLALQDAFRPQHIAPVCLGGHLTEP
jgi:hypothetical protein